MDMSFPRLVSVQGASPDAWPSLKSTVFYGMAKWWAAAPAFSGRQPRALLLAAPPALGNGCCPLFSVARPPILWPGLRLVFQLVRPASPVKKAKLGYQGYT